MNQPAFFDPIEVVWEIGATYLADPECDHAWGESQAVLMKGGPQAGQFLVFAGCGRCPALIRQAPSPNNLHDLDEVERWLAS